MPGRLVERLGLLLDRRRDRSPAIACLRVGERAPRSARARPGSSDSAAICSKSGRRSDFSVALMTVSASLRASISSRASKSASACSNDSMSIRSTSWSVRPYDGFTSIVCSIAGAQLARAHAEDAVRVDLEPHLDARQAGGHRRNAAQAEPRQRAAVGGQLALALQHVDVDRRLVVDDRS